MNTEFVVNFNFETKINIKCLCLKIMFLQKLQQKLNILLKWPKSFYVRIFENYFNAKWKTRDDRRKTAHGHGQAQSSKIVLLRIFAKIVFFSRFGSKIKVLKIKFFVAKFYYKLQINGIFYYKFQKKSTFPKKI